MFISNKQPEDSFNKVVFFILYTVSFLSAGLFVCIYMSFIFCLTRTKYWLIFRIKLFLQRLPLKSAKLYVIIPIGFMGSGCGSRCFSKMEGLRSINTCNGAVSFYHAKTPLASIKQQLITIIHTRTRTLICFCRTTFHSTVVYRNSSS